MATDNLAATVEDSFGFRESGLWVSNHQEDGRIRKTVGRYHARILQKMNWRSISHHAKLHRDAWGVCSKVHILCYSQNGKIEGLHLKSAISLNKLSMAICKSYAISAFLKQRSAASIRRTATSELQHGAKTKLSRTQVEAPQLLLDKYLSQMAGEIGRIQTTILPQKPLGLNYRPRPRVTNQFSCAVRGKINCQIPASCQSRKRRQQVIPEPHPSS